MAFWPFPRFNAVESDMAGLETKVLLVPARDFHMDRLTYTTAHETAAKAQNPAPQAGPF